ncbi:N-acetylglucosaminyldiphosphoundecaprenol N-acetyl-beta-D-mannosaminyltransferase [Nonomuraea solani]|uniref:N-acetylglucosaminyldiphosphoundecaprenol N-acetyl-beta-D-mannosaminyltransferase n=1 Tax=Nonomuraea solani TaxID=1144553 RepID=A0A1H6CLL1_9ACTN|nr:WecB/TagA/CpsF family glycosyltransferase [Nonomuraea solani]SEG73555.1 N-acetylglucosaminyldiphosphoundecaprenol N-acetyl-beta-D-mannosaminyltransferase [Nonomuraea solani]
MALSEADVADHVTRGWQDGTGGSIVTANVDIVRAATRDPRLAELVAGAELVVADGMPVVWAARIAGLRMPDRVTGASLVFTLTERAAREGRSVFLLGGEPGVAQMAGEVLAARYPGLRVAGSYAPPFGFDQDPGGMEKTVVTVRTAAPDLVLVGLGFPKQERVIAALRPGLPHAWYLGCGAGIPMAAGHFRRAPRALQHVGGEWLFRLALEPRRLVRRYLRDDLPFAFGLLAGAAWRRLTTDRRP